MTNSREIERAFTFMARQEGMPTDEKSIKDMVFQFALRSVTNDMGGYAPEPVIDNVMQQAQLQQRVDEARQTAAAKDLGAEDAAAQIHAREFGGGAGPVQRQVDKAQTLAETKPIDPKVRAEAGIPNDFKTYADLLEANKRLLGPAERKLVGSVQQVSKIMGQLNDLAFGFTDHKGNVRPAIFSSGDDVVSRTKHGIFLANERLSGTPLGVSVNEYIDAVEGMIRVLLELAGESGGRFTDKDVDQIKKQVAQMSGLGGLYPEGELEAQGKFKRMDDLLIDKLAFIHSPQMVTMGSTKKATKRWNPKTGKLEVIK